MTTVYVNTKIKLICKIHLVRISPMHPVIIILFCTVCVCCKSQEWLHQFSSVAQLCPTLCDSMNHSTPGLPVHHQLPEFTQTHVHQVGDAIQPSHPRSSPSPSASIPPSIRVFSNESTLLMRWPKYWSFSFSIIPSKEIPGYLGNLRATWGRRQHHSQSRLSPSVMENVSSL